MSADYPGAEEHYVPDNFMFTSNACKAIVIHETAGDATPQDVYNTFLGSGNPGRSAHFAVGMDGSVWQYVPVAKGAGANGITDSTTDPFWIPYMNQYGNLNTCTISVEHCTASPNSSTPLTAVQRQASFTLVSYLAKKYNIAADHIKPHRSICATGCPGTYPMADLIAYVESGGSGVGVPIGWHDDGTNLTAPNGIIVHTGFRTWILTHPWDAGDTPVAPEYGANPVELAYHQPVGPQSGTRQLFLYSELCWTATRGVYRASVGREFQHLYDAKKP